MKWFFDGVSLFKKSPLLMILMGVIFVIINLSTKMIPVLGLFVSGVVSNILFVGMMKACRDLDDGKELTLEHLFSGFNENIGGILALYFVEMASLILFAVTCTVFAFLFFGVSFINSLLNDGLSLTNIFDFGSTKIIILFLLSLVFCFLGTICIAMAFVYTPYLVCFKKQKVLESIQNSVKALISHAWPLTALGLCHLALFLLCILTLGLGFLAAFPIIFCSFYFSYKDIFHPAFTAEENKVKPEQDLTGLT